MKGLSQQQLLEELGWLRTFVILESAGLSCSRQPKTFQEWWEVLNLAVLSPLGERALREMSRLTGLDEFRQLEVNGIAKVFSLIQSRRDQTFEENLRLHDNVFTCPGLKATLLDDMCKIALTKEELVKVLLRAPHGSSVEHRAIVRLTEMYETQALF